MKKFIFNKEQFVKDYNELKSSRKMAKKYKADCFFSAIENNYSNKQNLYNAVLNETDK